MGAAFVEDFPEVLAKVRLLQEGYDKIQLEAKIPDFIERRIGEQARQIGMAYEQLPLIPLTDIHLTSHRTWELATNGNRPYLYIFSAVAVFILLIACVNFMNLATARAAERAKEVGLRKVVGAAISYTAPGSEPTNLFTRVEVAEGEVREANLNYYPVGLDFIDTYGLEMLAGRSFSRDFPPDTLESVVINEAMLAHFGWATPEAALEKTFTRGRREMKVIGVVKDFHYLSLHEHVQPLGLFIGPDWTRYLSLRLRTDYLQQTMADIEQQWQELVPQRPFDSFFLDDHFNRQYRAEERFASLFRYFAGLAILIACLGLFGLASFTAQQRTKEIGVRKVLGATVPTIVGLLSMDFVRLVGIAFVVAAPMAYFALDRWLADFAYHIELSAWTFLLAGLIGLLVALLTVSYQAVKAALADPVKSLRYE